MNMKKYQVLAKLVLALGLSFLARSVEVLFLDNKYEVLLTICSDGHSEASIRQHT